MYRAAGNETLHPVDPPLPSADVGAPMPFAAVSEGSVLLFYFGGLDVLDEHSDFAAVVVLRFAHVLASYLGVPNEEAISGHPLASSGLRPFEFVRVAPSPWIAELERMNRVHEHHDPARSGRLSHFAPADA
jgi:hypothetical protein